MATSETQVSLCSLGYRHNCGSLLAALGTGARVNSDHRGPHLTYGVFGLFQSITTNSGLVCNDLVYADDTLLIDVSGGNVQMYMQVVAECGKQYGLKLNWSKVEQMNINCANVSLKTPRGKAYVAKIH